MARAIVIDPMHAVHSVYSIHVIAPTSKVRGRHVAITVCKKLKITKSGQFPMARRSYQDTINLSGGCRISTSGWMDGRKDRSPNKCMHSFYSFLACSEKNAYDEQKRPTPSRGSKGQNSFNGVETNINLVRPRLTFSKNAFCHRTHKRFWSNSHSKEQFYP
jgi:hypothetical protein